MREAAASPAMKPGVTGLENDGAGARRACGFINGQHVLRRNGRYPMFEVVRFSPTAIEDGLGHSVSFAASVDGRPVRCTISAEALELYFHADPSNHEQTFQKHRADIEEAAEALIQARGISSGELRIGLSDLEGSLVAFGRSVRSLTGSRRPPAKG